jgi:hypothetical protein
MRLCAALAAIAVLSGCGNDPARVDYLAAIRGLTDRKAPEASAGPKAMKRAAIDGVGKPLLYGLVTARKAESVFALIQTRGPFVTWGGTDGVTLTFRDGVLVSSKGLGVDLTSAAVPTLAEIARGEGTVQRVHYSYDGGDVEVASRYNCQLAFVGAETLTIAELAFPTRHVVESCEGEGDAFRNEYWIETGGKLRQSRQYVSKSVGYLELSLLSR